MVDSAAPPGRRQWLILTVLALAQLMIVLDATIMTIALPSAQRDLGFSAGDRQWVVTAYSLAFGGLLVIGGRIGDLVGRRRTFIAGLIGFAAASAAGGAAPTFAALVAARAVQGAFAALLAPSALALLSTTFTGTAQRAKALSVYTAVAGGGGAIGLLLGGALTGTVSWRWCLYVNIAFAALALAGAIVVLPRQARVSGARLDLLGSAIIAAGLAGLVFGLGQASAHGWTSAATLVPIAVGVGLLAVFAPIESTLRHPLVPPSVLADRVRGTAYLGLVVGGIGVFGMFLLLTYYLQTVLGYAPLRAGVAFLPFVAAVGITSALVGNRLLPRLGPRAVVPAGMLAAAAGAAWLSRLEGDGGYAVHVLPGLILVGIGAAAILVPAFNLGPAGVPAADTGVASALVNSSNQIGGSIGAALLNTVAAGSAATYAAGHIGSGPAAATAHGSTTAFAVLTGVFLAGAVIVGLLYPARRAVSALAPPSLATPPSEPATVPASPAMTVPAVSTGHEPVDAAQPGCESAACSCRAAA